MNIPAILRHLTETDPATGAYKIPKIIYSDAYNSEMVAYADLILPDTTYLERWDCISVLDRPISDPDAAADSIRHPVVEPDRDVRAFQTVVIDLGARLKLPGFITADGAPKYPGGYPDYIINHERAPGIGPLAGFRGADGKSYGKGAVNPKQLEEYIANGAFHQHHLEDDQRFYKHANKSYLEWAKSVGFVGSADPIIFQLYLEPLQKFRLAARGHGAVQPPDTHRTRIETYFDPIPFFYGTNALSPVPSGERAEVAAKAASEGEGQPLAPIAAFTKSAPAAAPHPNPLPVNDGERGFPMYAITQRPMHMYHSWGSQNAWLRQITAENRLYIHRSRAETVGLKDDDWAWVAGELGRVRAQVRLVDGVNPDTVWTWNAIGKRSGAWGLDAKAPEATKGFLLNHLIGELLPEREGGYRFSNSDPVTGQAAWYDLRVRIEKADPNEAKETWPRFERIVSRAVSSKSTP